MTPSPGTPRPDAATLVRRLRAAGCVFAEEEAALVLAQARSADEIEALVSAREAGRPLEQVLGWAELAGVRVAVAPGVFVPRQRSALLVTEALAHARTVGHDPVVVLDLCCGTGALALVTSTGLRRVGRQVEVVAADLDPAAVGCARTNLPDPARVLRSDLYDDLPGDLRGRVDVLLANVPYVPAGALDLMPREAREHEAPSALDGGRDGLAVLRRLVAQAPAWLAPGGAVLTETSTAQADVASEAVGRAGLQARVAHDEELEATVVVGTRE